MNARKTVGRLLGAAALAAAALGVARRASAEARVEVIELRDGSVVQGELVELVPGDHVTVKLATGEIRRVEWADRIEQPAPVAAPPPPPPERRTTALPSLDNVDRDHIPWPQPSREPLRFEGSHLVFGAGVGWMFPFGVPVSAYAMYEPTPRLGFELDGRVTGAFGPGFREMIYGRVPFRFVPIGTGIGLEQGFPHGDSSPELGHVPGVAHFLDVDLFHEFAFGHHFSWRARVTGAYLLNGASFGPCKPSSALESQPCWVRALDNGGVSAAANGQRFYWMLSWDLFWAV